MPDKTPIKFNIPEKEGGDRVAANKAVSPFILHRADACAFAKPAVGNQGQRQAVF